MSDYEDAIILAIKAHTGQTRWNGDPYVTHPLRVARDVYKLAWQLPIRADHRDAIAEDARVAAVLHDVLEDTDYDRTSLLHVASEDVVVVVEVVTKAPGSSYTDFIDRIVASGNLIAILVKIADIEDNLSDLPSAHGLRKRYEPAVSKLRAKLRKLMGL